MRTKYLLLVLLISSFLIMTVTVSAQPDETDNFNSAESSEVHLPLLGWYVVPLLGAMRRRRHELNERAYTEYGAGNDLEH